MVGGVVLMVLCWWHWHCGCWYCVGGAVLMVLCCAYRAVLVVLWLVVLC